VPIYSTVAIPEIQPRIDRIDASVFQGDAESIPEGGGERRHGGIGVTAGKSRC